MNGRLSSCETRRLIRPRQPVSKSPAGQASQSLRRTRSGSARSPTLWRTMVAPDAESTSGGSDRPPGPVLHRRRRLPCRRRRIRFRPLSVAINPPQWCHAEIGIEPFGWALTVPLRADRRIEPAVPDAAMPDLTVEPPHRRDSCGSAPPRSPTGGIATHRSENDRRPNAGTVSQTRGRGRRPSAREIPTAGFSRRRPDANPKPYRDPAGGDPDDGPLRHRWDRPGAGHEAHQPIPRCPGSPTAGSERGRTRGDRDESVRVRRVHRRGRVGGT